MSWEGPGFGNFLSLYFHSLLHHFAESDSEFLFDNCMNSSKIPISKMKRLKEIKNYYIQNFLPKQISKCPGILEQSLQLSKNSKLQNIRHMDFHLCEYGILDNINIIKPIFSTALQFYKTKNNIENFNFHPNDVVIHYRTGDILHLNHPQYGSLHFSNYIDILNFTPINNIFIIWKSSRKVDLTYKVKSEAVINSLQSFLSSNLKIEGKVFSNQFYDDDFLFLVQAPRLITSISTYSLWAALMNKGKSYIPKCELHFNNRVFSNDNINVIDMKIVYNLSKNTHRLCEQLQN